jgi:hypothetical protein
MAGLVPAIHVLVSDWSRKYVGMTAVIASTEGAYT